MFFQEPKLYNPKCSSSKEGIVSEPPIYIIVYITITKTQFYRSAFFWFTQDERARVKMLYPDYSLGEMARELGRMWGNADAETKSKYEVVAEEDRLRYETVTELIM